MPDVLHGRYSRFLLFRLLFLLVSDLVLLGLVLLYVPEGSAGSVVEKIGRDLAPLILAGFAMTGIILIGSIDLSVASIIAVAASVFGVLVSSEWHPSLCYLACFLTAWSLLMVNGLLVRWTKLPAIIVTLGGLTFYRGVAAIIAELGYEGFSGNIYLESGPYGPGAYHGPGEDYPGWILLAVVCAALVWEWSAKTPRTWLALGNSPEACRLQGLSPGRVLQSAFCAGGIFLGFGAVIAASSVESIVPESMRRGFELDVIGAVVVGGSNIFGGEGSYAGTILGCFFFYLLGQLLIYTGIGDQYSRVVVGGAILLVIGLDCWLHRQEKLLEELR